jgi:hypothetical protein
VTARKDANDQHTKQINANARELQALGIQIQTLE